jgi:glutaminase
LLVAGVDSHEDCKSTALRRKGRFVSTGLLPAAPLVEALVEEALSRYRGVTEGANSDVYPALAQVPADLFGICVADTNGALYEAGDSRVAFTIMSVAKPFSFALACEWGGAEEARRRIGVNATGLPFNSTEAVERRSDGRTNPMVNAGAIATTSLAPGKSLEERWRSLADGLSRFAGRQLSLDESVYASATETNHCNRKLAALLAERGALAGDALDALDLYTRQSSLSVTARDLAVMGATLADGGVNPVTAEYVASGEACRNALAAMTTAGLYETSGDWLFDVGLPGKSGIGGGVVTVSPGKGGLGTFAPRLDAAGNSVKGQLVARFLSRRLGLDLFSSAPAVTENVE